MAETVTLTWTWRNLITVSLMGAIGGTLIVLGSKLWKQRQQKAA